MEILPLTGAALQDALPALADLRIRVFLQWPYLYQGSLEYEQKYLDKFSQSEGALIVIAREDGKIVGASTASPMIGNADVFAQPFSERGYDPKRIFYFGESVLLPEYRGRGIGHAFFDYRETHANKTGDYDIATFCGVVRAENDPRKPAEYNPLDAFWTKRGFHKEDGMITSLKWKEAGNDQETSHLMQFWTKKL
jgi:GNAT superfamily N-acetyltransferase